MRTRPGREQRPEKSPIEISFRPGRMESRRRPQNVGHQLGLRADYSVTEYMGGGDVIFAARHSQPPQDLGEQWMHVKN